MKFPISRKLKLTAVVILLIVAGISIGVIIENSLSERENYKKQQQLEALYNSSSQPVPEASSHSQTDAAENSQLQELYAINKDLVGWLDVGELSTPVVQTDNNHYYLTHDFYGKEDPHGTVYADARNDVERGDDNIVLYGHNYNKSKQMFYEVERYKDPAYISQHPVVSFTTMTEKRNYVVFGIFISNTEPSQGEVFDYHNRLSFKTTDEMDSFIGEVKKRSMINVDIPADSSDQLITLSTCGYEFSGQRVVLVARRLRDDETAGQFLATQYTKNENPLMPEIWVKLYGKK